ncbi:hypothetical protein N8I77_010132 [Diaporthe amygdali]|uniref:Secreted protein n=1 Tax=Phomopsis amygdali TaxID=1214568 RepID=A0AAD9VYU1_PHOAM|nr:hypothetical protein N8I77_010132 [Diaporthe amygdali]
MWMWMWTWMYVWMWVRIEELAGVSLVVFGGKMVVILAWPPAPDKRAVDHPKKQTLVLGPNKAFQYSNDNVIRHATTKGSTAAALRPGPGPLCAWAMTPPRGATTE